jgi:heme-degrading monooxygenase HmoA
MIAVIFEFTAAPGRKDEYLAIAAELGSELAGFDGFLSIERFQSLNDASKFVSLSFWRDEEAVRRWRNLQKHREAQAKGRAGIFSDYRLRVAEVMRDYTRDRRAQTPDDSVKIHG